MEYNAEIEFEVDIRFLTDEICESTLLALGAWHPSLGCGPSGRVQLTVTMNVDTPEMASGMAWSMAHSFFEWPVFSMALMPTTEFDRRYDLK